MNKIINDIEYEVMERKLSISEKFDEEPTIGLLASLLYYATQFATVTRRRLFNWTVNSVLDQLKRSKTTWTWQPAEESQ